MPVDITSINENTIIEEAAFVRCLTDADKRNPYAFMDQNLRSTDLVQAVITGFTYRTYSYTADGMGGCFDECGECLPGANGKVETEEVNLGICRSRGICFSDEVMAKANYAGRDLVAEDRTHTLNLLARERKAYNGSWLHKVAVAKNHKSNASYSTVDDFATLSNNMKKAIVNAGDYGLQETDMVFLMNSHVKSFVYDGFMGSCCSRDSNGNMITSNGNFGDAEIVPVPDIDFWTDIYLWNGKETDGVTQNFQFGWKPGTGAKKINFLYVPKEFAISIFALLHLDSVPIGSCNFGMVNRIKVKYDNFIPQCYRDTVWSDSLL